ncbi:unnamed protein product [Kluyveromyces dobzhanskii CBS 2104]|uniref:non-specific serine/threonine protein kinase n=1 Tax=Kluyveromyces dobzhanskii CBS 2104 TaxID=1427455 RepID=A0A0A8L1D8_9SACH|nr:unnamed protein product [Kluyveromyces dobzhanskii CBS 2104]
MDNSLAHGTYALKQVIGRGAYGVVYRAVKRGTNKPCAIKQIEFEDESELNEHMLEIDLLKNLRNQNIVEYRGFIQKSHELYIILEYCSRGSLRDILKHGPLLEDDTVNYVTQTLHGLRYLHEQGVIHRDIKAANLLLTEDGVVKLADFGVSTRINRMAMTYAGSPNWMAPEVMTGQGASTVSDTWSLGATVVELLTGNPPFHNLVNESACYAIVNEEYIAPLTLSAECRDFLARCFQKNMFKRATAQELLGHSWLNRIRKPKSKINLAEYVEKDDKWDVDFVLDSNTDMTPSPTKSPVQEHLVPADFKTLSVDQLFIEHSTDSIVVELIKSLCETLTATGNVGSMEFVNTRTLDVLKYDRQFNHSALKKKFIENGGLPLLISLRLETVLLTFFDKNVKLLIQCGILSQFSDLKNPKLIVLVSYHYRSLTSHDMWNRWCLSYKSKISSAVNTELTSTKCNEAEKLLLHISMVKDFPLDISKLMILAKRYTHLQNCTFTSLNNSIKRTIVNVPTSNLIHGKLFYEKSNFAQSITQWLLEMIPQVVYKATEPFVELCFHVCHLNNKSITLLMKDGLFLALTKRLLKSSSNSSLPWCLNLCSEYAKKLKADHIGTMIEIGVSSLSIANCLPNSIEIILNCYNVAQQIDLPIVVHKETITIGKYNVPLDLLVASFYQDNGRFDKYITKYTKFCSLPVASQVCVEVLDQERFIGRIHELFGRFKTSLIIQIDLLKFLKVLVIQINEQGTSSEDEKLQVLSKFLTSNWNSKENFTPIKQGHQRVGADSVLIQQLCQDIQHLIGV